MLPNGRLIYDTHSGSIDGISHSSSSRSSMIGRLCDQDQQMVEEEPGGGGRLPRMYARECSYFANGYPFLSCCSTEHQQSNSAA